MEVEESATFQQFYRSQTRFHYLATRCLILLIETGFNPTIQRKVVPYEAILNYIIQRYDERSTRLEYEVTLENFEDSLCTLSATLIDDIILVNFHNQALRELHSMCYNINIVLKTSVGNYILDDNFEVNFRMKVVNPIRCEIMRRAQIPSPCLVGLPLEILGLIINYCDSKSRRSMKKTCLYFDSLIV